MGKRWKGAPFLVGMILGCGSTVIHHDEVDDAAGGASAGPGANGGSGQGASDGGGSSPSPPAPWMKEVEGVGIADVATGGDEIYVTGHFDGVVDLGGGPLDSGGHDAAFVLRLDAGGNHLHSQGLVADLSQPDSFIRGGSIAPAGFGGYVVQGSYRGAPSLGGVALPPAEGENPGLFVARFAADGTALWSRGFVPSIDGTVFGRIAPVDDGYVVAGELGGEVDFGTGALSPEGDRDIFAVRLDFAGETIWAKAYGGPGDQSAKLGTDPNGRILLAGWFDGALSLTDTLTWVATETWHAVVLELDAATGAPKWARAFIGNAREKADWISGSASGDIAVVGEFSGEADFAGVVMKGWGIDDAFAVRLDTHGNHQFSAQYNPKYTYGKIGEWTRVAIDETGRMLAIGHLVDTVNDPSKAPILINLWSATSSPIIAGTAGELDPGHPGLVPHSGPRFVVFWNRPVGYIDLGLGAFEPEGDSSLLALWEP